MTGANGPTKPIHVTVPDHLQARTRSALLKYESDSAGVLCMCVLTNGALLELLPSYVRNSYAETLYHTTSGLLVLSFRSHVGA